MSRFNRKGSVTKGGRKRTGKKVVRKSIVAAGDDFRSHHAKKLNEGGIAPTRRQASKFRNGYGALHRTLNHA